MRIFLPLCGKTLDIGWLLERGYRVVGAELRLLSHGRTPEVHYYEGQDHIPDSDSENEHHAHLLAFFERTLF